MLGPGMNKKCNLTETMSLLAAGKALHTFSPKANIYQKFKRK